MLPDKSQLVEMNWDPITRIVGSLGIFTKIDFGKRKVAECHSTSSIFRGYSIFMKGKDPRDAHFITSRICGICGDNHATCATYAQNMAFGVRPPAMAEWIVNLGEAAEYMFDHNIFQDNLVGVDFCEQMVKETNPGVWEKAEKTAAPHAELHGYRTIADIMKALNPFTGSFYLEALQVSRMTREMFCLMEGRHVHPSTLYPGGVGTVPTVQLFTDYIVRLMKYVEFMKKVVPLHDDLFDFFYEALPGYEEVGRRRILLGCWGSFNNPDVCDYTYENMTDWGRAMYVTPGVVVDGKLVTTDLVDINLNIRILLGSSYYDDWQNAQTFVQEGSARQSSRPASPLEPDHLPQAAEARLQRANTPGSCRRAGTTSAPATTLRSIPAAARSRASGQRRSPASSTSATSRPPGHSVKIYLPKTTSKPEVEFEWKIPKWSNAIERDRARTYFQAYAAAAALYFAEQALAELHAGRTRTWNDFKVPEEAIGCGFHEAVRGVLSHHVVIRDHKIANYHPYPPTPWNANPRDMLRHARAIRGCGAEHAHLRRKWPGQIQGHRHHARRAQLRSLSALRRTHVPRQRESAGDTSFPDVRRAGVSRSIFIERVSQDLPARGQCSGDPGSHPISHSHRRRVTDRSEFQDQIRQLGKLITQFDQMPEGPQKVACKELVQLLMDVHGAGLERVMEIVFEDPASGRAIVDNLARDSVVSSLLVLYSLHPDDLETRVRKAVEQMLPRLRKLSCNAEFVRVDEGAVRMQVTTTGHSCGSSTKDIRAIVEDGHLRIRAGCRRT